MTELKTYFKFIFMFGICMASVSLFFQWYTFQAFSWEGEQVVLWEFHLFLGWTTPFSSEAWFNTAYQPENISFPLIINFIYLGIMILSLYAGLAINLEDASQLKKAKKYGYIHLSTLLLSAYYICIVPVYFFLFQELYFPYLIFSDPEFIVIHYTVSQGYWLQFFAFGCIFPYTLYFAITTTRFERAPKPLEQKISEILKNVQIPIDFHQLIAEERIELENEGLPALFDTKDKNIFEQFLRQRERP
jgi:hypothetical protein